MFQDSPVLKKVLFVLFLITMVAPGAVQAQTNTPDPPTPTPVPTPSEPPAVLIINPTPEPTPTPQGTVAQQFWDTYREVIIGAVLVGIVGSILIGVFLNRMAETVAGWGGWLFHWLFDRVAGNPLIRWRYDKTYRRNLADALQSLQGGKLVDREIRLDKMYVPALLTEEVRPPVDGRRTDRVGSRRRQQVGQKVDPWEAVRRFHRFVVLGGPGAGKTTYLYHLTYKCALKERPEVEGYLPIFIRFRDMIKALEEVKRLEEVFPQVLDRYGFPNAEKVVEQQLKQGRCLILLDGLDEVPSEDDHKRMISLVQAFADQYLPEKQRKGRNILVVSSRKYNYEHRQQLRGFIDTEVMEFDRPTIERFAHNWYEGELNHLADELLATLQENARFLELARNPLLLLLIVHHYERERNLPQQRADLYRNCVRTRIIKWNEPRGVHSGAFGETQKWRLLRGLALHMAQAETDGLMREEDLLEWVENNVDLKRLPEGTTPGKLLEDVARTSGLIQEWAIGRYGFSHQTLQEFFAAEAVDRLGPEDGAALLSGYLQESAWHEVVLLYCGLTDNAEPLLSRLMGLAQAEERDAALWLLAGQCMAEGAQQVPEAIRLVIAERLVQLLRQAAWEADEREKAVAACHLFASDLLPGLVAPLMKEKQANDLFLAAELLEPIVTAVAEQAVLSRQLLTLAGSEDAGERRQVMVALGRLRVEDTTDEILPRLQDPDPSTRKEAALALGQMDVTTPAMTEALVRVYEQDGEAEPRRAALQALLALGQAEAVDMVLIPAGEFLMGSGEDEPKTDNSEKPQHSLYLPAYFMDRTPVTNKQYRRFMAAGGYANPDYWPEAIAAKRWQDGAFLDPYNNNKPTTEPRYWQDAKWNRDEQPVVGVSWYEALAYARWAGKRLPSEAEWEKGARGTDARRYPWGNTWEPDRANTKEARVERTTPVGQYAPDGDSPYGLVDMAGNVWEWCSTRWWDENEKGYTYPYTPDDGREDLSGGDAIRRVLRGGSWATSKDNSRCASRTWANPRSWGDFRGIRCCATSSLPPGSES